MAAKKHWWYAVGVGSAVWTLSLNISMYYEEAIYGTTIELLVLPAFFLSWLLIPASVYFDLRTIRGEVAWNPSTKRWVVVSSVFIVNVVAGVTYFVRRRSAVREDVPGHHWRTAIVASATASLALAGTSFLLSLEPTFAYVLDGVEFLAWCTLPAAVYLDGERVRAYTDWTPRIGMWVLGSAVPLVHLFVAAIYLRKRRAAYRTADDPELITLATDRPSEDGPSVVSRWFRWAGILFVTHLASILAVALAMPSLSETGIVVLGAGTWPLFGLPFAGLIYKDMQALREHGIELRSYWSIFLLSALLQKVALYYLVARLSKAGKVADQLDRDGVDTVERSHD